MPKKPTIDDARLILELYDLRREAEMRKARHWWVATFWPKCADDFVTMARAYCADAKHFRDAGELDKALANINYAHGWLDAGARLGLFDVGGDDQLFTLSE